MARRVPGVSPPGRIARGRSDLSADQVRYFVCGTNRPCLGKNGQTLEVLMHEYHCAAMWEYPKGSTEKVRILSHMQRVEPGDLIFMFAKGKGIIGVGRATGQCEGPLLPRDDRRIRADSWRAAEWQVPVEWLHWEPENPWDFHGWNATFYDVSCDPWDDRREAVMRQLQLADTRMANVPGA